MVVLLLDENVPESLLHLLIINKFVNYSLLYILIIKFITKTIRFNITKQLLPTPPFLTPLPPQLEKRTYSHWGREVLSVFIFALKIKCLSIHLNEEGSTVEPVNIDLSIDVSCDENRISFAKSNHCLGRHFLFCVAFLSLFNCAYWVQHVLFL